jgi:methanogenic corrinoid protein MtbC1
MTAYRYVRTGRLEARLEAGLWIVDSRDLERFESSSSSQPSRRGAARYEGASGITGRSSRLAERLCSGDEHGAWALVEEALVSGSSPAETYLDLLVPALVLIGERWSTGALSIGSEHRATYVAGRLIGRMGPRFAMRGRHSPTVLVAAPPNDRHALPVALASDLLKEHRFDVVSLGADLPPEEIAAAAKSLLKRPLAAVLLGATTSGNDAAISTTLERVRKATQPGVVIGVGGAAIADKSHATALGADLFTGHGGRNLLSAAATLRTRGR